MGISTENEHIKFHHSSLFSLIMCCFLLKFDLMRFPWVQYWWLLCYRGCLGVIGKVGKYAYLGFSCWVKNESEVLTAFLMRDTYLNRKIHVQDRSRLHFSILLGTATIKNKFFSLSVLILTDSVIRRLLRLPLYSFVSKCFLLS